MGMRKTLVELAFPTFPQGLRPQPASRRGEEGKKGNAAFGRNNHNQRGGKGPASPRRGVKEAPGLV